METRFERPGNIRYVFVVKDFLVPSVFLILGSILGNAPMAMLIHSFDHDNVMSEKLNLHLNCKAPTAFLFSRNQFDDRGHRKKLIFSDILMNKQSFDQSRQLSAD